MVARFLPSFCQHPLVYIISRIGIFYFVYQDLVIFAATEAGIEYRIQIELFPGDIGAKETIDGRCTAAHRHDVFYIPYVCKRTILFDEYFLAIFGVYAQ